jgi:hypothetical protein
VPFESPYDETKWGKSGTRAVKKVMSSATMVLRRTTRRRTVRR